MNISDLSRTARNRLHEFARKGCVILARRDRRGGHNVRPIPVGQINNSKGIEKLASLLEAGWRIVQR